MAHKGEHPTWEGEGINRLKNKRRPANEERDLTEERLREPIGTTLLTERYLRPSASNNIN